MAPFTSPRCQAIPQPGHQISLQIEGVERLRWHYGPQYPRPFFFPLVGPSGEPLTRMGHPGAPDHEHHRSVWFAHHKVPGIDFWSDNTAARIRQTRWLSLLDSDDAAVMAVELVWEDGHDPKPLLKQELVAALRPLANGETVLELQATFIPNSESLEFEKTNFGFLAVRVAKSMSAHFGGGQITNSEGAVNEPAIFGQAARWMDYSGPISSAIQDSTPTGWEGITYVDHPSNPGQPTRWHVREDGWMGASPCMLAPVTTRQDQPLRLRYLLHAHRGGENPAQANHLYDEFTRLPAWEVAKSQKKHQMFDVRRVAKEP